MSTRCLSIGPRGLRWPRSSSFASRRWNSAVTSSVSLPTSNTTSSILLPTRSPVLTPAEVKALIPSMQDLVLWKWDQVTVAMSGGVDSAVVLRILSEMVCRSFSPLCSRRCSSLTLLLTSALPMPPCDVLMAASRSQRHFHAKLGFPPL